MISIDNKQIKLQIWDTVRAPARASPGAAHGGASAFCRRPGSAAFSPARARG
jgi:hypothetical protein